LVEGDNRRSYGFVLKMILLSTRGGKNWGWATRKRVNGGVNKNKSWGGHWGYPDN